LNGTCIGAAAVFTALPDDVPDSDDVADGTDDGCIGDVF
jgi:hypothetical protein